MQKIINVCWASTLGALAILSMEAFAIPGQHHYNKTTTASSQFSPLGINTNEALEVDSSVPFVDLFRLALPFDEARPWFTKGNVRFDRNGWPVNLAGGQAGTRFLSHIPPKALPKGHYTVLYDGQGKITYGGSAKVISSSPGRDVIQFVPVNKGTITATLSIKKSDPRNYIRNIRVIMPGGICRNNPFRRVSHPRQCANNSFISFEKHYKSIRFNPDYLNFMKDFKVLRFMNMSGVTRNSIRSWHQRPTLTKATWGGKEGVRGVPIEVMVDLANKLNANPWFNIPHNADDNFITKFAQYVKAHLNSNLKVYLEYSNETWNDVFVPQAEHMKQTGTRRKLDSDRRVAGAKFYSMQSVHIFRAWERVFGGKQRLVRVMGGMTTNTKLSHTILAYRNAYKHVDALAIAPYFHIAQDKLRQIRSVHQVFQMMNAKDNRYSVKNTLEFVKKQANITKNYGVQLIAYEGGQHLVDHKTHGMKEGATPYLVQANKHPRMQQEYLRLLNGWRKAGGTLFVAFSSPRPATWHGSWGVKEYINEPANLAPKYRALMGFNRANRCWWPGCHSSYVYRLQKPARIAQHLIHGKEKPAQKPMSVAIRKQRSRNTLHQMKAQNVSSIINGAVNNSQDLSAMWRSSWDDKNLYVWVKILDDRIVRDSAKPWADDSIELYIDADGSRSSRYDGKNDFQLTYRLNDRTLTVGNAADGYIKQHVKHKITRVGNGYVLDTTIPWRALKVYPREGQRIGFDVQINDDDTGNARDAKIAWNAKTDTAWQNPQVFGELVLAK